MPKCCIQCPDTICGSDVDDLFAYSTTKTVKIRDHRLGVIYYVSLFGVFVYIGVYSLAYGLGYLKIYTPYGTARFSLQQPTVDWCDPSDDTCLDDFPAKSSLNYCCHDNCEPAPEKGDGACKCAGRDFTNYDCVFYDGESASLAQRFGIFVSTRVREEKQHQNATCARTEAETCTRLWDIENSNTHFIAGIENFTVLIDHAAQVPRINFFYQARDVQGRLQITGDSKKEQDLCSQPGSWDSSYGGRPTTTAPCYIDPLHPHNSTLDVFHLSTLLIASHVDLDSESYAGSGHSARYEGMTMLLSIKWFNTAPWRGVLGTPGYTYELSAMVKNAYGMHEAVWDPWRTNRTLVATHGIMLQANIVGRIGDFDFNTLLLQLTASLTLLAVAYTVVNTTATYCLQHKHYYQHAMQDVTADFSEVATLEGLSDEALRATCKRRLLAYGGNRVELISRLVNDGYAHVEGSRGPSNPSILVGRSPSDVEVPAVNSTGSSGQARNVPLIS